MKEKTITEYFEKDWTEYSTYVNENRAIPSLVDGFKPVHRFLFMSALKACKNGWEKTAAVGGTVAKLGYHHGESSACDALTAMAAPHLNNHRLFEENGNFGNKLSPKDAGAPRYTKVRLSKIVDYLFKDMDLCPAHFDTEIKTPQYYLPIIPFVLLNGIEGIGVGFACDIPPHSIESLIDVIKTKIAGKPIGKKLIPQYPMFKGEIARDLNNDQYIMTGTFKMLPHNKVEITELPFGYSSESYENVLDKLEEKKQILSYENNSRNDQFNYIVQFPRAKKYSDAQIIKILKLEKTHSWNLTFISEKWKLKAYDNYETFIDDWYNFRIQFIQTRIDNKRIELHDDIDFTKKLIQLTSDINANQFDFRDYKMDKDLEKYLLEHYKFASDRVKIVMDRPMRSFSTESLEKLKKNLIQLEQDYDYYQNTTKEKEWLKDLAELEDYVKKSKVKK